MSSPPIPVYTTRVDIRWRDMDAFRHVNNAVYLTYLEEARDEWFLEVLGNGLLLNDFLLARCAIDYRSPLTQDDGEVEVEIRCTRVGNSSVDDGRADDLRARRAPRGRGRGRARALRLGRRHVEADGRRAAARASARSSQGT